MKLPKLAIIFLLSALLLGACSSAKAPGTNGATSVPPTVNREAAGPQLDLTRSDAQGAVTVELKPENLDQPTGALVFDVSMNTHMVDLSMDLAKLSVLATDTGKIVQAIQWQGPGGGHHVQGKLSFPATVDGAKVLEGAHSITITIKDVDAPVRNFTWQLPG